MTNTTKDAGNTRREVSDKSAQSACNGLLCFLVTDKAMRPASKEKKCFYCHQSIGEFHAPDCVLINKKVTVKMTVEYEIEVPANWDKEQIEFHRNDGSWCSNNAIDELNEISEEIGCICRCTVFKYVGGDSAPYLNE